MSSRLRTSNDAEGIGCFGSLLFLGLFGIWLGQWISGANTFFVILAVVGGLGLILMISGAIFTANEERKQQQAAEQLREDELARLEADRLAREQQRKDELARLEVERLAREKQREAERSALQQQQKDRLTSLEAERLARQQQYQDTMAKIEAERQAREQQWEAEKARREEEEARRREEMAFARLYTWNQQFEKKPWASRISFDIPSHLSSDTTQRLTESLSLQDRKVAGQREAETRSTCAQTGIEALERILAHRMGQVGWQLLIYNSHTIVYPSHTVPRPETFKRLDSAELAELTPHVVSEYARLLSIRGTEYAQALVAWNTERETREAALRVLQTQYFSGEPSAIEEYAAMVLAASAYPDYFLHTHSVALNPPSELLLVEYQLPTMSDFPTLQEVRYIMSRDQFVEKHITQSQLRQLYDSVLYQIALRTMHELFSADEGNYLASIVFNGYVQSIDLATGHQISPCVISVQANKIEFMGIDLSNVDPRACFRKLKGVSSSTLHSMTPIPPILTLNRDDKRFVMPRAVVDTLDEGDNLAAMDWEDFEHLVRELFSEEFARPGGEVKVTHASRDGGIDAVAFDPDPIHGGKIVIQAKRYTNTVGVSAVRDLYGTLMNEGANKGILVTTSDYGSDAYDFARGKPLVLLNGSNLLHLLEKHGHKAHIDLAQARRVLAQEERLGR